MFHQVLDNSRKSLLDVLRERSSVLDLLCHNVSPVARKTGSQPVGLDDHKIIDSTERATFCSYAPDALGPYTPETDQVRLSVSYVHCRQLPLWHSNRDFTNKEQFPIYMLTILRHEDLPIQY